MANSKALRRLHREASSGDPWGDAMSTWFAVASELYVRGLVPSDWEYSPGAAEDPREGDSFWYDELIRCDSEDLVRFGYVLKRFVEYLERIGKSY